jgi:hypothetical protein
MLSKVEALADESEIVRIASSFLRSSSKPKLQHTLNKL